MGPFFPPLPVLLPVLLLFQTKWFIRIAASIAALTDPAAIEYANNFVQDGLFWEFLAYCAGTGGSILIICSAAVYYLQTLILHH